MRGSLCWLLLSGPLCAQYRTPEWESFHNTTYVGEEPEEARLALFRADEHLEAGRHREAAEALLEVLRGETSGLVRYGERLVLPLERAVALKLCLLPEAIRAELRARETATAERLAAESGPDLALEKALRLPLSELADQVRLRHGTRALLDGDYATAAGYLEEIVHGQSASAGSLRELAAARLLQALDHLGEAPEETALTRWPEGEVRRADGAVSLPSWRRELLARPHPAQADWPTLLGSDCRARLPATPAAVPRPLATHPAALAPRDDRVAEEAPHRHRFDVPGPEAIPDFPAGLPVVGGGRVVTLEEDGVHVRGLGPGGALAPLRYDFDLHLDPREFRVLPDASAAMLQGDLLVLNLAVQPREAGRDTRYSALYAVDLARDGFVEFRIATFGHAPEAPLADWVFAGPAVHAAGRLYIVGSRLEVDETHCRLFSFAPGDGRLLASRELARASAIDRYADRFSTQAPRRIDPSPLAACRGILYVCTNLGVVAALRASDCEVQWIFRYNRLLPVDSQRFVRENFYITGGWPGRAPVVRSDRLFVSPSDSRYLYSLARWPSAAGDLILDDPVEKEHRLAWLGERAGEFYFLVQRVAVPPVGQRRVKHAVQATDHAGGLLWETPPLPAEEPVAGVPALSQRFLYLPTDRLIYRLDLERQGFPDLVVRPPLALGELIPPAGALGDLVATDGLLLSQSCRYLHVYEVSD